MARIQRRRPTPRQAHRSGADLHIWHRPAHGDKDMPGNRHESRYAREGFNRSRSFQTSRLYRPQPQGRRRSSQRGFLEYKAPCGNRLLPRYPPQERASCPRPAHEDERAHPQGPNGRPAKRKPKGRNQYGQTSSQARRTRKRERKHIER